MQGETVLRRFMYHVYHACYNGSSSCHLNDETGCNSKVNMTYYVKIIKPTLLDLNNVHDLNSLLKLSQCVKRN